ncbi:MAG TPA: hypothetical protein VJ966_02875 [Actinomycetes bacterium]|nr:hypothetical protein [Actinomycetes bacterium]
MVRLKPRTKTVLAWSLWLASMGCCAGGLLAALLWVRPLTLGLLAGGAAGALAFPVGYATVGLVLSLRRPANPIGWLYAVSGLAWALDLPFEPWLEQLVRDHWLLPVAAQLAVVAGSFLWGPGVGFGITLPFLLLPDGRLRSRGWRLVVVTAVTGAGLVLAAGILMPGPLGETSIANPFPLTGRAGTVATVLFDAGLALHAASAVAALISLVLRFRSSVGVERQQLRWVTAGGAAAVAGLLPAILVGLGIEPRVNDLVIYPAVLCVPVAVAVAVLRYRLWDLDRLVSRTVTYALVTGLLVLPYLLAVPVAGRLAAGTGSLGVAAATLAAAALFQPLRRRVQALVDRRFNRRRYDAARTVDWFATRLRDQVDLDALHGELLGVVDQTVQPTQASLWLRPPAATRPSPNRSAT